jgi:hypothetical protein
MSAEYAFTFRVIASDREGYYYDDWSKGSMHEVIGATKSDALDALWALIGLLSLTVDAASAEEQESIAQQKWDECDAALGRVLALADTLDAYPNATLKPMAFGELAARIRAAVDGTEPDGESA